MRGNESQTYGVPGSDKHPQEMTYYDSLPPALRKLVRESPFELSSFAICFHLALGHSEPDIIRHVNDLETTESLAYYQALENGAL